jgi:hypothetical protein
METAWPGANRIWKTPVIQTATAFGEKGLYAKLAVDSNIAVQHALLGLLQDAACGKTDNYMKKLINIYRLSLLATGDAQRMRENLLGINAQKLQKEEVLSET